MTRTQFPQSVLFLVKNQAVLKSDDLFQGALYQQGVGIERIWHRNKFFLLRITFLPPGCISLLQLFFL